MMLILSFFARPSNSAASLPASDMFFVCHLFKELATVNLSMERLTRQHEQVVRMVIMFVAINMVNYFPLAQGATQFFGGDDSMNRRVPNLEIFASVRPFVCAAARIGTVFAAAFSSVSRSQVKRLRAVNAQTIDANVTGLGIAKLRTPSPFTGLAARFTVIHFTPPDAIIPYNREKTNDMFSPGCLKPGDEARATMSRPIIAKDSDYTGTLFEL